MIQMRSAFQAMQHQIKPLSTFSLPHPSLHTLIPRLVAVYNRLLTAARCDYQPASNQQEDKNRSHRELTLLVTDFTDLLNAMVPILERLGSQLQHASGRSSRHSTSEEQVFWELWSFLAISSDSFQTAYESCPGFWAGEDLLLYHALYAAFYSFFLWLLPFSRSPAWTLVRRQRGHQSRNGVLAVVLAQPLMCLCLASRSTPAYVIRHFASLQPNLLPLLCCITTEQFGTMPPLFNLGLQRCIAGKSPWITPRATTTSLPSKLEISSLFSATSLP